MSRRLRWSSPEGVHAGWNFCGGPLARRCHRIGARRVVLGQQAQVACAGYGTYGPRTGWLEVPLGTTVDSVQLDGVLSEGTTPVTAAAVSGLTATISGPGRVSVNWVNPTSPGYRYTVIRVEQGTPVAESPTAGTAVYHGTGTSTKVTGLIAGETYTVTAFAIDKHGNVSDPSNVVVVASGPLAGSFSRRT